MGRASEDCDSQGEKVNAAATPRVKNVHRVINGRKTSCLSTGTDWQQEMKFLRSEDECTQINDVTLNNCWNSPLLTCDVHAVASDQSKRPSTFQAQPRSSPGSRRSLSMRDRGGRWEPEFQRGAKYGQPSGACDQETTAKRSDSWAQIKRRGARKAALKNATRKGGKEKRRKAFCTSS